MENVKTLSSSINISFEEMIETYGTLVSSICRRMIQDEETAKDAAQEVWIEVIKSLPSFQGNSKFSTWLYTIAHRVVMAFAKQEKHYSTKFLREFFDRDQRESPDISSKIKKEQWVKEMCDKCLTGMLHCLDNETRMIYIFREMAQLSYPEIARILGKEQQSIRKDISRSRKKLRNFLKDECVLFNPQGSCRCRMRKWVEEVDLPREYQKIRETVHSVNLFRESEIVLPRKNYWKKFL